MPRVLSTTHPQPRKAQKSKNQRPKKNQLKKGNSCPEDLSTLRPTSHKTLPAATPPLPLGRELCTLSFEGGDHRRAPPLGGMGRFGQRQQQV